MKFFKPSDIVTVHAVIQNMTAQGAAFAGTEDDESVFIPPGLAQQYAIDAGDSVTCYCLDQHREEHRPDKDVSARYRAMRIKVEQRLSDVLPGSAASDVMSAPKATKQKEITVESANRVAGTLLKRRRAWTVEEIIEEIEASEPGAIMTAVMKSSIYAWIDALYKRGSVARCVLSAVEEDDEVVYYAGAREVFVELIESYELDD
jgi:hypothetical protein